MAVKLNWKTLKEGVTVTKQTDDVTGLSQYVVIDGKQSLNQQIAAPNCKIIG